jgi:hypothetical protein
MDFYRHMAPELSLLLFVTFMSGVFLVTYLMSP